MKTERSNIVHGDFHQKLNVNDLENIKKSGFGIGGSIDFVATVREDGEIDNYAFKTDSFSAYYDTYRDLQSFLKIQSEYRILGIQQPEWLQAAITESVETLSSTTEKDHTMINLYINIGKLYNDMLALIHDMQLCGKSEFMAVGKDGVPIYQSNDWHQEEY